MSTSGKISALFLASLFLLSVFAPLFYHEDPHAIDLDSLREPPGFKGHLLGTDQKGRDILARIFEGGKTSMAVAFSAALVAMSLGLGVGLVSGYYGGKVDTLIMALVDLILAFPALLLAIGISVVLPPGVYTVMLAIAAVGWASFARLTRGYVLGLRESEFVLAAKAIGCSGKRILLAHILPQCVPLALTLMTLKLGGYIITEASLSFLGLGAQPPAATWGSMISQGRAYISAAPWISLVPGLFIALTALGFNVLGDALSARFGIKTGENRKAF